MNGVKSTFGAHFCTFILTQSEKSAKSEIR
jgi:hypothetical protein